MYLYLVTYRPIGPGAGDRVLSVLFVLGPGAGDRVLSVLFVYVILYNCKCIHTSQ